MKQEPIKIRMEDVTSKVILTVAGHNIIFNANGTIDISDDMYTNSPTRLDIFIAEGCKINVYKDRKLISGKLVNFDD